MLAWLKGLVGKILILVGLVAAAYAGWRWGALVFPKIHELLGLSEVEEVAGPYPTPELADSVMILVQQYRRGEDRAPLALGGNELTSVLQHSLPGFVPDGIMTPEVTLRDGRVNVKARVSLQDFPELPDLGPIIGILPDTLDVGFQGSLTPFDEGRAALLIHRVEAARIPLPRRLIPEILAAMGRRDAPGLPSEAVLVPLPSGLGSAYILADSLILSNDS
jgi:hypothetical protein